MLHRPPGAVLLLEVAATHRTPGITASALDLPRRAGVTTCGGDICTVVQVTSAIESAAHLLCSACEQVRFGPGAAESIAQLPENVAGKLLLDLAVPGNRLTCACSRVLVPIVPAAMPQDDASGLLDLPNEVDPFHVIWSSAT
jgi:hypothetical protein